MAVRQVPLALMTIRRTKGQQVKSGTRDHVCALLSEALALLDAEREIIVAIYVDQALEALECRVSDADLRPGQAAA